MDNNNTQLNELIADFKEQLLADINDDVYDHMKEFLGEQGFSQEQRDYARDYFCEYMTGTLVWQEEDGSLLTGE